MQYKSALPRPDAAGDPAIQAVHFVHHDNGGDMASTWVMKPEVHAEDAASS